MRQAIYIEERSFPHDRPPNFVADHRISGYTSSRNFSQQSMQSALRNDTKICGRELPVVQNSLSVGVPLTLPSQSWRKDPAVMYSDSSEVPMNSRDIPKNPDFCMFYHKIIFIESFCLNLMLYNSYFQFANFIIYCFFC